MNINLVHTVEPALGMGYIAGTGDGVVTLDGIPARRLILLYEILSREKLVLVRRTFSLSNGHYMFKRLDASKKYLVMVRDFKKQFEPCAWDYVTPATDLTIDEQQALWQSWRTI